MADDQDIVDAIKELTRLNSPGGTSDPKKMKDMEKTIGNLTRKLKANSSAVDDDTDATIKGTKGWVRFGGALAGTTRNVGNFAIKVIDAGNVVRENREQFTSLNGSIDIAAGMFKTTAKLTAGLGDAAGTAISAIPLIGPAIGGLVSGVSKAAAALAEATADIAAQIGKKITAELDNANTAFRMMAQSGAVGADGLTGLANQAIQAGISFKDFASVTKESAAGLAFAFGDTATGAKKFADASEAMTPFRRELTALGVGAKQQNEMTANYIKLQARQGNIEGRSSQSLAQGSAEYIKRLTALSRLTGKSVEEQQKELDSQMSNARMVGALAEVQAKYGQKAASNMSDTAAFISNIDEDIGKGLQDALSGNLGTDAAQQFAISAGEMGDQAVKQLRNGEISAAEASAMIQQGLKKTADNFGGAAGLGKLAGLGTPIEQSIKGLQKFSTRAELSSKDFQKVIDKNKELATTTDAATNNLVDSSVKMQKFATELDKISLKLIGDKGLVSAVGGVTDAMLASATEMNKMVQMGPEAYAKSVLAGPNSDETVEKQDAANEKFLTGFESVSTKLAQGLEWFVGGFSKDAENAMQASRVMQQTKGGMAEGRFGAEGVVEGFKLEKRALGGPVSPGESYMIGESGPEMLTMGSMGGMVTPNAGPAGGSVAALGGLGNVSGIAEMQAALAGNAGAGGGDGGVNALAEAQVNRLDQLITQMARSNSTNEEILQATRQ